MEIFSSEVLRYELELNLIVAHDSRRQRLVVVGLDGHFLFVPKRHVEVDRFRLNGRIDHLLHYLTFARKLLFCRDAGSDQCQQKQTACGYSALLRHHCPILRACRYLEPTQTQRR